MNPNDIKELPIPRDYPNFKSVINLLEKFMTGESDLPSNIELELDELVYNTFSLTEEDINIVEAKRT